MLRKALFFRKNDDRIKCYLCPHNCNIPKGKYGLCSVRKNEDGVLKTVNYGEITSIALDPIEKKPLYNFKPNGKILSVGSFGCNFTCDFCQNYSIAHYRAESKQILPDELVKISLSIEDNIGIAFTYNEPSIWFEYIYDTSKKLKEIEPEASIVVVTNGYIESEPLMELLPFIDAMNIDLKSIQPEFYEKICGGNLETVLKNIEIAYKYCHIEITTLLVNSLNDSSDEIKEISRFLAKLDKDIPLHLTRYFPNYKMKNPPTEIEKLFEAKEIAMEYLNYVYLGNIPNGVDTSNTYCPKCGHLLIERKGYYTTSYLEEENCPNCKAEINIVI